MKFTSQSHLKVGLYYMAYYTLDGARRISKLRMCKDLAKFLSDPDNIVDSMSLILYELDYEETLLHLAGDI